MVKTVYIGQSFLSRPFTDGYFDDFTFYGANHLHASTWQINFGKEQKWYDGRHINNSSLFSLNIDVGISLRFSDSYVYIQKDGSVETRKDHLDRSNGICKKVASIRVVDVGQDFLTIEYEIIE